MNRKSLLFVLPLIALVLMSCRFGNVNVNMNTERLNPSGNLKTETREVSNVERVSLEDIGALTIVQGNEEGLTIEADDNLLPYIESTMRGNELVLGIKNGYSVSKNPTIRYTLKIKSLNRVSVSGAGSVTSEKLDFGDLDLDVSGSGNIRFADLAAKNLTVKSSGSGNFDLKGKIDSQDVSITGAGNYTAGDLQSSDATVRISGAGNVTVWVTSKLSVHITGFGNVNYYGSPEVDQSISGGGGVKSLGAHK
jgi:hypothetical protein